jgi:hypothetical protein
MTMKKSDVKIGATYLVKVAGNLAPVKITREHDGGWDGASVKTGKTIRIKSAQRLRKRLDDDAPVASEGRQGDQGRQAREKTRHGRTWRDGWPTGRQADEPAERGRPPAVAKPG